MSEPIWVTLSAKIPGTWATDENDTPAWLEALGAAFINGSTDMERTPAGDWHVTVEGEGNYGSSDSWAEAPLAWLEANRVPHEIHDEAKYEFAAEDKYFDGNEWWEGTSAGSDYALTSNTWNAIKSNDRTDAELVEQVNRYFERMAWTAAAADIAHLPAEMPAYDQETQP